MSHSLRVHAALLNNSHASKATFKATSNPTSLQDPSLDTNTARAGNPDDGSGGGGQGDGGIDIDMNPEAREPLPPLAFNSYASRFQEPLVSEGFESVVKVGFCVEGAMRRVWRRYAT